LLWVANRLVSELLSPQVDRAQVHVLVIEGDVRYDPERIGLAAVAVNVWCYPEFAGYLAAVEFPTAAPDPDIHAGELRQDDQQRADVLIRNGLALGGGAQAAVHVECDQLHTRP
jgi:hypothetical protein